MPRCIILIELASSPRRPSCSFGGRCTQQLSWSTAATTATTTAAATMFPRLFRSSARLWRPDARGPGHQDHRNFYQILGVPVNASRGDIKKKFYALSLTHHPDKNQKDPSANARFSSISAAYSVLSNENSRAKYDRDHHIQLHSPFSTTSQNGHNMRSATARSGSHTGSRPASGLKKRRGSFQGPPKSFYSHGGYGTTGRGATHNANQQQHQQQQQQQGPQPTKPSASSFIHTNEVPHFDAAAHHRSQERQDERRREQRVKSTEEGQKRRGEMSYAKVSGDSARKFFTLTGVVAFAIGIDWIMRNKRIGKMRENAKTE